MSPFFFSFFKVLGYLLSSLLIIVENQLLCEKSNFCGIVKSLIMVIHEGKTFALLPRQFGLHILKLL